MLAHLVTLSNSVLGFRFSIGVFKIEKGCVTHLWPKIAVLPGPTENWFLFCFNLGFGCPMSYSTTGSFSSPPSPHESSLLAVTGCFEPFNSATQVHGNWRHIASELVSCDRMSDRTRPSQIPVGSIPVATQTTHTELKLIYGQVLAENYNRCSPPWDIQYQQ